MRNAETIRKNISDFLNIEHKSRKTENVSTTEQNSIKISRRTFLKILAGMAISTALALEAKNNPVLKQLIEAVSLTQKAIKARTFPYHVQTDEEDYSELQMDNDGPYIESLRQFREMVTCKDRDGNEVEAVVNEDGKVWREKYLKGISGYLYYMWDRDPAFEGDYPSYMTEHLKLVSNFSKEIELPPVVGLLMDRQGGENVMGKARWKQDIDIYKVQMLFDGLRLAKMDWLVDCVKDWMTNPFKDKHTKYGEITLGSLWQTSDKKGLNPGVLSDIPLNEFLNGNIFNIGMSTDSLMKIVTKFDGMRFEQVTLGPYDIEPELMAIGIKTVLDKYPDSKMATIFKQDLYQELVINLFALDNLHNQIHAITNNINTYLWQLVENHPHIVDDLISENMVTRTKAFYEAGLGRFTGTHSRVGFRQASYDMSAQSEINNGKLTSETKYQEEMDSETIQAVERYYNTYRGNQDSGKVEFIGDNIFVCEFKAYIGKKLTVEENKQLDKLLNQYNKKALELKKQRLIASRHVASHEMDHVFMTATNVAMCAYFREAIRTTAEGQQLCENNDWTYEKIGHLGTMMSWMRDMNPSEVLLGRLGRADINLPYNHEAMAKAYINLMYILRKEKNLEADYPNNFAAYNQMLIEFFNDSSSEIGGLIWYYLPLIDSNLYNSLYRSKDWAVEIQLKVNEESK